MASATSYRLGYVAMSFPLLSETFVINEVRSVREQGIATAVFSLRSPREPFCHNEAAALLPHTRQLPFFFSTRLWWAVGSFALRQPRLLARATGAALAGTWRRPRVLVRTLAVLPKSVLLAAEVRRLGIGHLHAHFANYPATAAWVASRLAGVSFSFTAHAHDLFVDHSLLATKLREAAAVFTISDYNRSYLRKLAGERCCPVHVVRMGANLERFPVRAVREGNRGLRMASVGRLDEMKGFHHLIQACRLLDEQGVPFQCLIAGAGEQRPYLERMIEALRLGRKVILCGWMDSGQVAELLAWADCFVLPCVPTGTGKQDGIPVALMEAMACGLAVVSTTISGIPELVRPGCGLLVKPGDVAGLAQTLEQLTHPGIRTRLGRAARAVVEREYDARANARQMAEHLRRLADLEPPSGVEAPAAQIAARKVPVLMYHRILPRAGLPPTWPEADPVYTLPEAVFRSHLDYLQEAGYRTILPEQLWRWALGLEALPEKAVLLTFDDGDPSHAEVAAPALAERGMRGTFFAVASWVGSPAALSWRQLGELVAAGHAVGSHGFGHRALAALKREELEYELRRARQELEGGLGQQVLFAAVPHGSYSRRVARTARRLGYLGIFTSGFGCNRADTSPLGWRRIPVRAGTCCLRLSQLCGGAFPYWQAQWLRSWALGAARGALGEERYRQHRRWLWSWRGEYDG